MQVTENALDLARDTYGNYVIQHSLAFGSPEEKCAPPSNAPPLTQFLLL